MEFNETDYEKLEREAATVLGYMLFEYSRLDMELGLKLAWANDGEKLTELTNMLKNQVFNNRLIFLEELVKKKYIVGTRAERRYAKWLSNAHKVRTLRNQLFHGRWGIQPQQQLIANITGLPNSPDQKETLYSINQLQDALQDIQILRNQLSNLRKTCPV